MLFTKSMMQRPGDRSKQKGGTSVENLESAAEASNYKSSARQHDGSTINPSRNLVAALRAKAEQSPNVFVGKSPQNGLKVNNFFHDDKV